MMSAFETLRLSEAEASSIALEHYAIKGVAKSLDGDIDFNYFIKGETQNFILKICRPDEDIDFLEFQIALLNHLNRSDNDVTIPAVVPSVLGDSISFFTDQSGQKRAMRLLTWVEGNLWSGVSPHTSQMRYDLGVLCGKITHQLSTFQHEKAHRLYDWDLAQAAWTFEHLDRFSSNERAIISFFHDEFRKIQSKYAELRSSIIHHDPNDNNIIVQGNALNRSVVTLIDYGDAIYSKTINDAAVACAYAIMGQPDPLRAATEVIEGYHSAFQFTEDELACLYSLISMRLVTTVTKSSIAKEKEPENEYLTISEKPAWEALKKWRSIHPNLAHYSFRKVCNFAPHPNEDRFHQWVKSNTILTSDLFPTIGEKGLAHVDMSVSSSWLGNKTEYEDDQLLALKLGLLQREHPDSIIAGGYLEVRPLYTTDAYRREGNNGFEYRNTHLGMDFWLPANTPIHTPFDAEVIAVHNNNLNKDYGPTVILKHSLNDLTFYSLYGHLSNETLNLISTGDQVKAGQQIGTLGTAQENGNWTPHLHFQLMLDLLGNTTDFPGTCFPNERDIWQSICPNPALLLNSLLQGQSNQHNQQELIDYRSQHLGKSLSLSYDEPLYIVRGDGAHLIDINGRKYLDTVNNVAHVGHEHPNVVKAGQQQMALLNTNTRYLNQKINEFASELLATFPKELSVVHFVNSGSEANELALRMAKAYSGQSDMIAVEVGYHGNTNGCIDISSYKFDGKGGNGAPPTTHIVPLPDQFRGRYRGENTGKQYASHVETAIANIHQQGKGVAGFIAESIISCGGQIELPEGYLSHAYQAVRNAGGVCISDEVQVGCGRVGSHFWGFQLHDVIPDIVTIGKPIGNGHPLAAVVCTQEVAQRFANGMEYFNTFGGNPVSSAIGAAVLKTVKQEKLQKNALETGEYLKEQLHCLSRDFPIIGDVRGQGLFLGIELVNSERLPLEPQASYLANRMKEMGVLMSTDGPDHNVLKIKPPIVFSKENADELIERMKTILNEEFMTDY